MLYNIIILEYSTIFYCISCDCVTVTVTMSYEVTDVQQYDSNVTLILTLDLKNRKVNQKEKEKRN